MRIKVSHEIRHRFTPPARGAIQNLRLTPHGFESQYVLRWRIGVDADCVLRQTDDAHGNIVSSFSLHGPPIERLVVSAEGEVETTDAAGVIRGAVERLPPETYLRQSPLAYVNGSLRGFAAEATAGAEYPLDVGEHPLVRTERLLGLARDPVGAGERRAHRQRSWVVRPRRHLLVGERPLVHGDGFP